jgi:hypothetical protein
MTELVEQISNFNADHPLSLLFDRCRTLADRAGDGSLPFVEAVDMPYSAGRSWSNGMVMTLCNHQVAFQFISGRRSA